MKSFVVLVLSACLLSCVMLEAGTKPSIKPPPKVLHLDGLNTVILSDEVTAKSVYKDMSDIIGKRTMLDAYRGAQATLYIIIGSRGGSVEQGENLLKLINAVPSAAVLCKFCASEAGYIFVKTTQPKLVVSSSVILMHEMTLDRISAKGLTPEVMAQFKKMSSTWNQIFADKLKITLAQYELLILNKELVYVGKEIVKKQLADELVNVSCDPYISTLLPATCDSGGGSDEQ